MAYLTIIAQTFGFEDSYGYFTAALLKSSKSLLCYNINGVKFKKHRFDRVVITNKGDVLFLPPVITRCKRHYEVDQWMGAFKTGAAMEHIGRVHKNGGRILTNFRVGYLPHNIGKPKKDWTPNIAGLEDLEKANNCTMVLDDIKKILERWNCAEAVLVSKVVNASRKERVDIIITSQRTVNSVPKDIREVCTNYEIPFVTVRDQRIESPDGMGTPLEVEIFNISATGNFLGFGIWNGYFPDGCTLKPTKKMLDMYDTTEVVTDLKGESSIKQEIKEPYCGYNNEMDVINDLKHYKGTYRHIAAEHPQGHPTDILFQNGKMWSIDAVACSKDKYPTLQTAQKDFTLLNNMTDKELDSNLIAFKWKALGIRYIKFRHFIGKSGNVRLSEELKSKMLTGDMLFTRLS